jgi:hypothetical protein
MQFFSAPCSFVLSVSGVPQHHVVIQNNMQNCTNASYFILLTSIIRMRWVGLVACTGETRNMYKVLITKHERKRLFLKPRHEYQGNIKVDVSGM